MVDQLTLMRKPSCRKIQPTLPTVTPLVTWRWTWKTRVTSFVAPVVSAHAPQVAPNVLLSIREIGVD